MESSGGMIGETATLLSSLWGIIDGMKAYHLGVPGRNARFAWPLTCSEVFTGHAANNGLRIFMRKLSTGPPRPFVRPASDLIKGMIMPPHQVFE